MTSFTGLEGRVALVTDGGDDVGRAIVLALAAAGAKVAVHARHDQSAAESTAKDAAALGVDAIGLVGDIADPEVDRALVEQVQAELGPIDILVQAGDVRPHPSIVDTTIEEWRNVMDTNCSSFFYLARLVLPSMTERGFGRLIAVNVGVADRSRPLHGAVAAARAATTALVKVIALEGGPLGVTANVLGQGVTETARVALQAPELLRNLQAIPRPARLDEISTACLYLASDQGAYITGQTFCIDGGFQI